MIEAYEKALAPSHRFVTPLFNVPVYVEEKIDGSQFSFRRNMDGTIECRSKGAEIDIKNPPILFRAAVETVIKLCKNKIPNYKPKFDSIYYCETLQRPKHNTKKYDRVPKGNIILFDILDKDGYQSREAMVLEAGLLNIECVPMLAISDKITMKTLEELLTRKSCLGDTTVEGVVVKPQSEFDALDPRLKRITMKLVNPEFREEHSIGWKANNPSNKDKLAAIGASYATPARWQKAVQHLAEQGLLSNEPKDIGPLLKEIIRDIWHECEESVTHSVMVAVRRDLERAWVREFPVWYKSYLQNSIELMEATPNQTTVPRRAEEL